MLTDVMIGGIIGVILTLSILAMLFILVAVYVYFSFAWMTIAKKLKYKNAWLAWIPIANFAMILNLGGFHWALIFLLLIPILGWIAIYILLIIATWKIFEKRKYPGWLSLVSLIDIIPGITGLGLISYGIVVGMVAWQKK